MAVIGNNKTVLLLRQYKTYHHQNNEVTPWTNDILSMYGLPFCWPIKLVVKGIDQYGQHTIAAYYSDIQHSIGEMFGLNLLLSKICKMSNLLMSFLFFHLTKKIWLKPFNHMPSIIKTQPHPSIKDPFMRRLSVCLDPLKYSWQSGA